MPSLIGRCGGGGGGLSKFNGQYFGNTTGPITTGAAGFLTWNTLQTGDAALDISTPSAPTVTRTGYWAVSVDGGWDTFPVTVGAQSTLVLSMTDAGAGGVHAQVRNNSAPANATFPAPEVSVALTQWMTAGSVISVYMVNGDAVNRGFTLNYGVAAFLGGT